MPELGKITTFLMFDAHAEEAITFYTSLFADSEILNITRYGPDGPGGEGTVQNATFALSGQVLMATDSTESHKIGHNPYLSLYVQCESEEEIERLYRSLSADGATPMPLGSYGFSAKFAWVTDRWGIPWQLNLPHQRTSDWSLTVGPAYQPGGEVSWVAPVPDGSGWELAAR